MAVYRTLSDFKPGVKVTLNDHVYFGDMHYSVNLFTLTRIEAKNDDKIFKFLNIRDIEKFCRKYYGYHSDVHFHVFPHFKSGDYEAATRVIIALMERYEKWGWWYNFLKKIR